MFVQVHDNHMHFSIHGIFDGLCKNVCNTSMHVCWIIKGIKLLFVVISDCCFRARGDKGGVCQCGGQSHFR